MGQMERVENVRTCFVAADDVKASAGLNHISKCGENGIQPFTIVILHTLALLLAIIFIFRHFICAWLYKNSPSSPSDVVFSDSCEVKQKLNTKETSHYSEPNEFYYAIW